MRVVKHWRVGTIARQLGVHHGTVRRVLAQASRQPPTPTPRASRINAYRPFIARTLAAYPTLTAARLYVMVCEHGSAAPGGGASHFRYLVAGMRPRAPAQAHLRLRTLPGEQMQMDWAPFGHLEIGRARRALMAFVMVLSYSWRIFASSHLPSSCASSFLLLPRRAHRQLPGFLRGHAEALRRSPPSADAAGSSSTTASRVKSAVLDCVGDAVRFNAELLALARHYRFEPRAVAVARGSEANFAGRCPCTYVGT